MMTPERLAAELKELGYSCSKRQILDWISKGLLPKLSERGQGQGRGKLYFWSDSAVVQQAITVHVLRSLKYPTDVLRLSIWLMGFPCDLGKVRSAWLSRRLHRMRDQQAIRAAVLETRRHSPFFDIEDKASELSLPIAVKLSRAFHLEQTSVKSATLETYGLFFGDALSFDAESLEHVIGMVADLSGFENPNFDEQELAGILDFLKSFAWKSIHSFAKYSTNDELEAARGQWLQLVKIFAVVFPVLNGDFNGIPPTKILAVNFASACLSPFLALIKRGKRREINITLQNVSGFVRRHEIPQSLSEALLMIHADREFRAHLISLINDLSLLWRHRGFPFLPERHN